MSKSTNCWTLIKEEIFMMKWRVLSFTCFMTFGSYYIFDFPASIGMGTESDNTIQKRFEEDGKSYTNTMNNSLYSVYSYPNTVLAIFGGLLIDKFLGLRKSMILFISLIFLGASLFFVGVWSRNFYVMLLSRILFGLGGESLGVSQSTVIARWFTNSRGMALAFGIVISFARVGSSINFIVSPVIANKFSVVHASFAGIMACCVSLIAVTAVIIFDIYGVRKGLIKGDTASSEGAMKFGDFLKLPAEYWLLCIICVFCYCAIFPFVGIAKNFFQVKFKMDGALASFWVSLYQISSACFSPVIGGVVDQIGRYPFWLCLASSCFLSVHLFFLGTPVGPFVLMPTMGIFYSFLVGGLWPCVPYTVPANMIGCAYGLSYALQNIGLATFPLITGAILDAYTHKNAGNSTNTTNTTFLQPLQAPNLSSNNNTNKESLADLKGYYMTELVFIGCSVTALLTSIILVLVDKKHGGILCAKPSVRNAMAKQRQEEKQALIDSQEEALFINGKGDIQTPVVDKIPEIE